MSQFKSRLLAEGVRAIEGVTPQQTITLPESASTSFQSLLLARASAFDSEQAISQLFSHFERMTRHVLRVFGLLMFCLGAFAVKNMLFTEQSAINFFWAFALFFIPNLFMLLLWLTVFCKPTLFQGSALAKCSMLAIKQLERRFNKQGQQRGDYRALFNCYFETYFAKQIGRYQLSKLTHLMWLNYFTGATLMALLMLATHQVDFVWQTSILSTDAFQSLTQLLAYLPQQLGLPVPSIEQIQQSHLGNSDLLDAENRRLAWSSLLISSLLFYGLLPRLLLLLLMTRQLSAALDAFQLDLSLPYYVQLRQLLKPNKTTLGVTDADDESVSSEPVEQPISSKQRTVAQDADFYPLAIELSTAQLKIAQQHLQQFSSVQGNLVNVCDYVGQQDLLRALEANKKQQISIYVALKRVPDRGLKRFIGQLTAIEGKQFQLLLVVDEQANQSRDNDWYRLADEVGIELDNVIHIETQGHA